MLARFKALRTPTKLPIAVSAILLMGAAPFIVFAWPRLSAPSAGAVRAAEKDGMAQVYVPAGPFTMGDAADTGLAECRRYRGDCLRGFYLDAEPQHTVTLGAFWIDRTEVTNAMVALCVKEGRCRPPAETTFFAHTPYYGDAAFDNYPVRYVTWDDARAYCAWAGRRLPTEAEWEKAARGTGGRQYPWGDEPATGERDNFCDKTCPRRFRDTGMDDGYPDTAPVDSYPRGASPYGAWVMAGNLREWVSSLYVPYPYRPDDGREDMNSRSQRVVRGGHWDGSADFARAAYRVGDRPEYRSSCVGFRCASSP